MKPFDGTSARQCKASASITARNGPRAIDPNFPQLDSGAKCSRSDCSISPIIAMFTDGPGIILIGFEGDYSVDNTDGRLGCSLQPQNRVCRQQWRSLEAGGARGSERLSAPGAEPAWAASSASMGRTSRFSSTTACSRRTMTRHAPRLNRSSYEFFTGLFGQLNILSH